MKKIIFLLPLLAFAACKKDNSSSDPTGGSDISAVPTAFTQKVLFETITGAGQAQCPDGFVKMDAITAANPTKAIPVYIHFSDAMEMSQYTALYNQFGGGMGVQFPSAMVNRTASVGNTYLNRLQWQSNFDVAKAKSPSCGLAMTSTISGNNANIEVHAGFKAAMSGNYNLTVYLVEDNVTGTGSTYDQRNSYNTVAGHPYYNAGDPIASFNHRYVLRKVLSSSLGDAITTSSITAGGEFVKTYTASLSGYKSGDVYVIAFINKAPTSSTNGDIMNVQIAKVGAVKDWD